MAAPAAAPIVAAGQTDARLYDATGTLIPAQETGAPPPAFRLVSPGAESDARDRFRGYPSRDLTARRIARIQEAADAGDLLEWVELCEEIVEKDAKIQSVLHTRTAAVTGTAHEVVPLKLDEDDTERQPIADEIAKFCGKALDRANTDEAIGDLMDSVGKPLAVDWIHWGLDRDGKVVPQKFSRIPTRHLRWAWDSDTVLVWNPYGGGTYSGAGEVGTPLPPFTTIRALNNERRDGPTRAGLLRVHAWLYLFKITAWKDWVIFGERYGMPVRVIKLSQADFHNAEVYNKAREAARSIGSDSSGVISDSSDLELVVTPSTHTDVFKDLIDKCDREIAQVTLGHELSSQSSPGQGQLGITAAMQVRQDYLEGDCTFISEIFRRDVLVPMTGWNFGWENADLAPRLQFDYEPPKDLTASANILAVVAKAFPDLEFSRQQLRDTYGYDAPLEGEEDDAITEGGSGGSDAGLIPDVPPGVPDVSINAATMEIAALGSEFEAFAAARRKSQAAPKQKTLDALTSRGARLVAAETSSWRKKLRAMVVDGAAQGLTAADLARRLAKAYPELDAGALERVLREQVVLARLFGRAKA